MQVEEKVWYLGERAEQLALLYLSRRDDLIITKLENGYGPDLLVEICPNNHPTGRMIGIEIKALLAIQPNQRGEVKIKFSNRDIDYFKDTPFPLCLFVFAMQNDAAYYRWLKEPVSSPKEGAILVLKQ